MTTVNVPQETLRDLDELQNQLKKMTGGDFPKGRLVAIGVEKLTLEKVIDELGGENHD